MKSKILLAVLLAVSLITPTFAYQEIECSTDLAFSENSCNQCFKGTALSQWSVEWSIFDEWLNDSATDMILYKEIQEDPRLVNLSPDLVQWTQVPSSQGFWEYTSEFDNIYSEAEDGYVLEAGKKITWIKSKLGYGYSVTQNSAAQGENIGMLVFPLTSHALLADGTISEDSDVHNECVLFKSAEGEPENPVPTPRLPETGPAQFIMLAFFAMLLSFVLVKARKES